MIDYQIIGTGSDGNAVVIDGCILIDCGVPFKSLSQFAERLKLVLLTHVHGDHFCKSTIRRLAKDRPTLRFGCGNHLVKPLLEAGVSARNIDIFAPDTENRYAICSVTAFPLCHDVPNVGYKLITPSGRYLYATDTNSMDGIEAKDYDLYLVEANYEDEEIKDRIAEKWRNNEYSYEYRARETHLSKAKCDAWIYSMIGNNGQYIYMHSHRDAEKE